MKHVLAIAALWIASVLSPVLAHAGACAPMGWLAQVITPSDHAIPNNGGIVVVASPGGDAPSAGDANPAVHAWKLSNDTKSIDLEVIEVAPGVAIYRPKKPLAGPWKVVAGDGTETGSGVELSDAQASPLAAPTLSTAWFRRVTRERNKNVPSHGPLTVESFGVTLAERAPKEALGLVLYRKSGDELTPATFSRISSASGTSLTLWSTPGRCARDMPGQIYLTGDDQVVAAWIDRNGLVSAHSAVVTVSADVSPAPQVREFLKRDDTAAGGDAPSKPAKKDGGGCATSNSSGAIAAAIVLLLIGRIRVRARSAAGDR